MSPRRTLSPSFRSRVQNYVYHFAFLKSLKSPKWAMGVGTADGLKKGIRRPSSRTTTTKMTNEKHKKSLSRLHRDNNTSRPRRLVEGLSLSWELLESLGGSSETTRSNRSTMMRRKTLYVAQLTDESERERGSSQRWAVRTRDWVYI